MGLNPTHSLYVKLKIKKNKKKTVRSRNLIPAKERLPSTQSFPVFVHGEHAENQQGEEENRRGKKWTSMIMKMAD